MRFVVIPFVVLAASVTLAATPTATTNTFADYFQIDMMRRPEPVYVVNFPDVQSVEGTVAINNLPAVQTVGGTVNVGNLPLDTDGAVRVTTVPARQTLWYELLDEPLTINGQTDLPTIINTDGYSRVGVSVNRQIYLTMFWSWGEEDQFSRVQNWTAPTSASEGWSYAGKLLFNSAGTRMKIRVDAEPGTVVDSIRVYLFP